MPKCPGCGIERTNISTPCSVCGYKPAEAQVAPQPAPSAQRPARAEEKTLWQGHPSGLYYVGHWIVGILLLMFYGLGLLVIIYAILDRKTKVFTLTTRKVMAQSGIISRKTSLDFHGTAKQLTPPARMVRRGHLRLPEALLR